MTIAEAAKQYGVTQQAVYQKMKRKGIRRADIQQPGTAELTPEGEAILASLFEKKDTIVAQQALKQASDLIATNEKLQQVSSELEAAQREAEGLKQAVAQRDEELSRIRASLQAVTEERDFLRLALNNEQQNHMQALLLLQPSPKEAGLLARIKARFTKKGEPQQ